MKRKLTIIAMMFGFGLGCLLGLPLVKESLAQTGEDLALAQAKFGFKLFNQLMGEEEQNLFISPASISFALGMTYNGAAAETRQAMAKTLEIQSLSLDALNQGNAAPAPGVEHFGPEDQAEPGQLPVAEPGAGLQAGVFEK